MAEFNEAVAMIHAARKLIQRYGSADHKPDEDERLGFLAASESFLSEGCGITPQYWRPTYELWFAGWTADVGTWRRISESEAKLKLKSGDYVKVESVEPGVTRITLKDNL